MFCFKNLLIYRLADDNIQVDKLVSQLEAFVFKPCASYDREQFGWIPPLADSEELCYNANNQILLIAQKEEKILPAQVIRRAVITRINEHEAKQGQKLRKNERLAIYDSVVAELTSKAFSKYKQIKLWLDLTNKFIFIDTASYNTAELILGLLRKTLGSLAVIPLETTTTPSQIMTRWLLNNELPNWLEANNNAELKSSNDSGIINIKFQELLDDEVINHLKAGKYVTKLALNWDEHLSFVLTDDFKISKLKFAQNIQEVNDEAEQVDKTTADFHLMTGELSALVSDLLPLFGGEKID